MTAESQTTDSQTGDTLDQDYQMSDGEFFAWLEEIISNEPKDSYWDNFWAAKNKEFELESQQQLDKWIAEQNAYIEEISEQRRQKWLQTQIEEINRQNNERILDRLAAENVRLWLEKQLKVSV